MVNCDKLIKESYFTHVTDTEVLVLYYFLLGSTTYKINCNRSTIVMLLEWQWSLLCSQKGSGPCYAPHKAVVHLMLSSSSGSCMHSIKQWSGFAHKTVLVIVCSRNCGGLCYALSMLHKNAVVLVIVPKGWCSLLCYLNKN